MTRPFSKEGNLDNLVRAINFLLAFKHLCLPNVFILAPSSLTLLLSQILSLPNLTHT